MPIPTEHKTVQARILEYAEAIGSTFVSQKEAEQRRGFDASSPKSYAGTSPGTPIKGRANASSSSDYAGARGWTSFFEDLLDAKVREFNPRYAEAEGALPGKCQHQHTEIYGNPPSPKSYGETSRAGFFDHEEKREREVNHE